MSLFNRKAPAHSELMQALTDRCNDAEKGLLLAQQELDGLRKLQTNRAALVSIVRDGRFIRFSFFRNGKLTTIETYSAIDCNVNAWIEELLN